MGKCIPDTFLSAGEKSSEIRYCPRAPIPCEVTPRSRSVLGGNAAGWRSLSSRWQSWEFRLGPAPRRRDRRLVSPETRPPARRQQQSNTDNPPQWVSSWRPERQEPVAYEEGPSSQPRPSHRTLGPRFGNSKPVKVTAAKQRQIPEPINPTAICQDLKHPRRSRYPSGRNRVPLAILTFTG